jgi:hypothetical protein
VDVKQAGIVERTVGGETLFWNLALVLPITMTYRCDRGEISGSSLEKLLRTLWICRSIRVWHKIRWLSPIHLNIDYLTKPFLYVPLLKDTRDLSIRCCYAHVMSDSPLWIWVIQFRSRYKSRRSYYLVAISIVLYKCWNAIMTNRTAWKIGTVNFKQRDEL